MTMQRRSTPSSASSSASSTGKRITTATPRSAPRYAHLRAGASSGAGVSPSPSSIVHSRINSWKESLRATCLERARERRNNAVHQRRMRSSPPNISSATTAAARELVEASCVAQGVTILPSNTRKPENYYTSMSSRSLDVTDAFFETEATTTDNSPTMMESAESLHWEDLPPRRRLFQSNQQSRFQLTEEELYELMQEVEQELQQEADRQQLQQHEEELEAMVKSFYEEDEEVHTMDDD